MIPITISALGVAWEGLKTSGGGLKNQLEVPLPAGRASEPAGRALEPVGRV